MGLDITKKAKKQPNWQISFNKITVFGNFVLSLHRNYNKEYHRMEIKFKDAALSELYEKGKTNDKKYKHICKNKKLIDGYVRAVGIMYGVDNTEALKPISFLHYEKLKYQKGEPKSSVRLVNGMVERLIFTETEDGIEVELIEIDSTHYGNKK